MLALTGFVITSTNSEPLDTAMIRARRPVETNPTGPNLTETGTQALARSGSDGRTPSTASIRPIARRWKAHQKTTAYAHQRIRGIPLGESPDHQYHLGIRLERMTTGLAKTLEWWL
jgi:hypothetical protein